MAVMDLCSGDGWFTLQIAKLARHVVAIDIDADLLEVARHRPAESGVANCDFVAGNAYELTRLWPRRCAWLPYNRARCTMTSPDAYERFRVAFPSGLFAVVNPASAAARGNHDPGRAARSKNRIENVARRDRPGRRGGGLKLHRVVEVPPYHYGAVFERPAS
jgi:SAM-dependent methyltransferase